MEECYFEIKSEGNLIRIESFERIFYDSDLYWDKNWLKTNVILHGGPFSGQFSAEFLTSEFDYLKLEIKKLNGNLSGAFSFLGLEGQLRLDIRGDGLGHFTCTVIATDNPRSDCRLEFEICLDQTFLNELVRQLEIITNEFPIVGSPD